MVSSLLNRKLFYLTLVLTSQLLFKVVVAENKRDEGLFDSEPDLYITVSSEPDCPLRRWYKPWPWFTETKCDLRLELNWINLDRIYRNKSDNDLDYIGLFRSDPNTPTGTSQISQGSSVIPPDGQRYHLKSSEEAKKGYYKTTVRFERPQEDLKLFSGDFLRENPCLLKYWIGYVRETAGRLRIEDKVVAAVVLKSKCLQVHPFWMSELKEAIGDLPVTSLLIPGTHNSGSWERYKGLLRSEINPIATYEITQELSIYEQLLFGIRYLDVRATHHPFLPRTTSKSDGHNVSFPRAREIFWISHDSILPQIPLSTLVSDVVQFQEETNREEIVFVDFHRVTLKGLNQTEQDKIHGRLIELLDKYLGRYLVPYKTGDDDSATLPVPTLNELWKKGKTVFLTYPEESVRKKYPFLWPSFQHSWANTNNVTVLENYLKEDLRFIGCRGRFWSLMAELTPTVADILTKPHIGLRSMAQAVNSRVTEWFRRKPWYSRGMVVATDYFLGNNLIEMAIKANKNRAVCPRLNGGNSSTWENTSWKLKFAEERN